MPAVLHILPHRGGGAETYLDLLERLPGTAHARAPLSDARTPLSAGPSIVRNWPRIAYAARRADLVHAHGDVAATLALPILRARPSVWTTHGLHALRRATGPTGATIHAGVAAAVRATSVTLCCSHAERDEVAAVVDSALRERLVVVPNGVDLPPASQRRSGGPAVALYLGQLEDRKDPLTAVRAANAAAADGAPLELLVAGDGPLLDAVRREAGPAVRVLGFRDDPECLLERADVFVLPSRREGISFAVLEAMAQGLAMVVADEAGNREAVGDAGLVLPPGDVTAFADALGALSRDATRRAALGVAARERVAREFPVRRLLDGVAGAYAAAIRPGPAAGAGRA